MILLSPDIDMTIGLQQAGSLSLTYAMERLGKTTTCPMYFGVALGF
jgi:hypothetical protein